MRHQSARSPSHLSSREAEELAKKRQQPPWPAAASTSADANRDRGARLVGGDRGDALPGSVTLAGLDLALGLTMAGLDVAPEVAPDRLRSVDSAMVASDQPAQEAKGVRPG
jgi:hypothetical protein